MSAVGIALTVFGGLLCLGVLAAMLVVGVGLLAAAHAEACEQRIEEAAATPDQLGADILPDGSPAVQRSRLWPPSLRLREDYVEAAESAYDWTAAEADASKRRSR